MQLDGGDPLPGLWQWHQQVVGKGHPGLKCSPLCLFPLCLSLSVSVVAAATPTGKKAWGWWGGGQWRLPLFLTLVRKPSLLLRGE